MIQTEMLAQLRRNGGSGFDRQDRRFVCKDSVGCGGGWLEMAYRRKNLRSMRYSKSLAQSRYVPALPAMAT